MSTKALLTTTILSTLAAGCIVDDEAPGGAETVGYDEGVELSDLSTALEGLAISCNFRGLYLSALEAADDAPMAPSDAEMYTVTDFCLNQVEDLLLERGMTLDFAGPLETDTTHRAVLVGIHSMFFSPMFTPPGNGGVPSVFDIETGDNPYPASLTAVIPEVPASFEYEIPHGFYNVDIAHSFFGSVAAIEDHTDNGENKTARFEGGTLQLLPLFEVAGYLEDGPKTAALVAHEVAHSYLPGHKSCEVPSAQCGVAGFPLDATCDCDYEQSTYWVEAAFAEAAALGRVVSFAPVAQHPIDGGVAVAGYFPTARCEDAAEHVTPFRETHPRCDQVKWSLVKMIESASSYWEGI
ncbi:MAG: hypothetical protein AAF721_09980 [Myxococcota bacterium]